VIDAAARTVTLDPRHPPFVEDPYAYYRAIRSVAPAFFWTDYGLWCFAAHEAVGTLLRDRRFGRAIHHVASRAELGWPEPDPRLAPFDRLERFSMLDLEPPEHTRLRGLVNRAFVSREIVRLEPRIAELAHRLIDGFAGEGTVDLLPRYATEIPLRTIADLIGVPAERRGDLLAWSHAMVAMYRFGRDRAVEERAVAASLAFEAALSDLVAERRRRPREDLLTRLVLARDGGAALTDAEIISTAVLLLNAGHEATVHALCNAVRAFLAHGVRPDGSDASVEEALRFDPPLHLFTRYALADLTLESVTGSGGEPVELRRGDRIGLLLGAANRDGARFAAPDVFDPTRPPGPHVSFGAGIHFCLGAPLARLELKTALPILFGRLPSLRLAAPARYADTYHFRGLEQLLVAW
jgi:cytochrome P450